MPNPRPNDESDAEVIAPTAWPGWDYRPHDGLDWWRTLLIGQYAATVAELPPAQCGRGFVAVVDGELLEGPDSASPYTFASEQEAMDAAKQCVQSFFLRGQYKRRFTGVQGNGADFSDHDAITEKWLCALTRR